MELTEKAVTKSFKEYNDICRLMVSAFPSNEQIPLYILRLLAIRRMVNFRAFYDDDQFCGVLYTAEDSKYMFVLYLAVNDRIRSKGYGSRIIDWMKLHTAKIIVLNVETMDPFKENAIQREKRMEFYRKNGIIDTRYRFNNEGEIYSVLASDVTNFVPEEYEKSLREFSFGVYKKK